MSELLLKPDYIVTDAMGRMIVLYCKICGVTIGQDHKGSFIRFRNYAEVKMRFMDDTNHVANLCTGCLEGGATEDPGMLMALYNADMAAMFAEVPTLADNIGPKLGPRVVAVDVKRRGIP